MAVYTRRALTNFISRSLSSSSPLLYSQYSITTTILQHPNFNKILNKAKINIPRLLSIKRPLTKLSNKPPKETILLDGCDYEHWLIVLEFPDPKPSDKELINAYVQTLAQVVVSEKEAKKNIYLVMNDKYTRFSSLISEELSNKVKELSGVLWVLPDSYHDVPNKDYGGDLYVDGKVIVRLQYHYNQRTNNTRRPHPRYDRRRETMPFERREPMPSDNWESGVERAGVSTYSDEWSKSYNNGSPQQTAGAYYHTIMAPGQSVAGAQAATMGGQNSFNRDQYLIKYNIIGVVFEYLCRIRN